MAAVATRGRTGAPMIRHRSNTGPSTAVRAVVMARAGNCCERCGISIADQPASIHHRQARGMGGTKDPAANDVPNLALLCGTGTTGCHGHIESHRTQAIADGWIVPKWGDPQPIRMVDVFGNRFRFDDDERVDL